MRSLLASALLATAPAALAVEAEVSGGLGGLMVSPNHELVAFPNDPTPIGAVGGAALRGTVYPVRLPYRAEAGLSWEGDLQAGNALVGGHRLFASLGAPIPGVHRSPVIYVGAGYGVIGARSEALGRDMDWSGAWGGGVAMPVVGDHVRVRLDLRHHLASAAGFEGGGAGHVGAHVGVGYVFGRKKWAEMRGRVLDLVSGYEDHPTHAEMAALGELGQSVLLALAKEGTLPPSRASRVVTSMAAFPDDTTKAWLTKKATSASPEPWLQRKAVWALVTAYEDEAVPIVQQVLQQTDDVQVKVAIGKALDELGTPAADAVVAELPGVEIGVIHGGDSPEAVDGARLVVTHPDGRRTSHLGSIRFVDAALAVGGEWTIEARKGRCERGEVTVATPEHLQHVDVPLTPLRPGTLSLVVTTPEGEPVPGAVVSVRTDEPACAPGEVPPMEGHTGDVELGEGTYEVYVTLDGYGTTQHEVTLSGEEGEVVELAVQLQPTTLTIEKGKISTQEIYFDSGAATLKPESLPALQEIATSFAHLGVEQMLIEGHTDDRGTEERNVELSQARADSVRAQLIELGVPADALRAEGFGSSRPVAPNTTSAGRAKNRRVDFVIIDDTPPEETE
jgi:outer membrane protein OmpA-like peptidoglycan-associated protein